MTPFMYDLRYFHFSDIMCSRRWKAKKCLHLTVSHIWNATMHIRYSHIGGIILCKLAPQLTLNGYRVRAAPTEYRI